MKKLGIALSALVMSAASTTAMAEEVGSGCGLGKMIFEGKSGKGANIAAAIINDVIIPKTFFMTTASIMDEPILGCDPNETVMRDEERDSFVASNLDNLSQEAAQGHGEHLAALADIIGIDKADQPTFFDLAQQEYDLLFPASEQSPEQVMASLNAAMAQHPELARYSR